jgi:hypothetical protein
MAETGFSRVALILEALDPKSNPKIMENCRAPRGLTAQPLDCPINRSYQGIPKPF